MLTFYHCPGTRSGSVHWLLEELGVPFETEIVRVTEDGGATEGYRAIQPNKKVPAIEHNGTAIFESAAIVIYLADAFPKANLAPAITDPQRAAYLTWIVYLTATISPVNCWTVCNIRALGQSHDAWRGSIQSSTLSETMQPHRNLSPSCSRTWRPSRRFTMRRGSPDASLPPSRSTRQR